MKHKTRVKAGIVTTGPVRPLRNKIVNLRGIVGTGPI